MSPTLRDGSCSRNSKNDFSDVTFNYFYSDSQKVPRIKADVLTPVNLTPYNYSTVYVYKARLARRFIVGANPELKFRTTDEADTAHVVSELPAARKP